MNRSLALPLVLGSLLLGGCASTGTYLTTPVAKAPSPPIPNQYGKPVDLAAATADGWSVVFFYPKASTPG